MWNRLLRQLSGKVMPSFGNGRCEMDGTGARLEPPFPGMQVALDGAMTASLQAISRSAKHRLDRGIHTSSGAGDLRRARAAAERLCILAVRLR